MNKTKGESSYYIWSALILFCVVLAVFTLAFASCAFGSSGESTAPESSPVIESQPLDSEAPETDAGDDMASPPATESFDVTGAVELGETEDMGQEYIDKFVFLGDSTTYGLAAYNIVEKNQVWTPANGTLSLFRWDIDRIVYPDENAELFIPEAAERKKPEYMLITLGINGVSFLSEEDFTMFYKDMLGAIQQASPDTKIILNSIYPVAEGYDTSKGINNQKIDAANLWVKQIAEDMGVKFLNSASILKDETGALGASYHTDYIHLNSETFELVIEYIRTHGYV